MVAVNENSVSIVVLPSGSRKGSEPFACLLQAIDIADCGAGAKYVQMVEKVAKIVPRLVEKDQLKGHAWREARQRPVLMAFHRHVSRLLQEARRFYFGRQGRSAIASRQHRTAPRHCPRDLQSFSKRDAPQEFPTLDRFRIARCVGSSHGYATSSTTLPIALPPSTSSCARAMSRSRKRGPTECLTPPSSRNLVSSAVVARRSSGFSS